MKYPGKNGKGKESTISEMKTRPEGTQDQIDTFFLREIEGENSSWGGGGGKGGEALK